MGVVLHDDGAGSERDERTGEGGRAGDREVRRGGCPVQDGQLVGVDAVALSELVGVERGVGVEVELCA